MFKIRMWERKKYGLRFGSCKMVCDELDNKVREGNSLLVDTYIVAACTSNICS